MLVKRLRELIVLVASQLAGEDFQLGAARSSFSNGRAQEHVHLRAALGELANIMQGVIDGDYVLDSFTLQTAHRALGKQSVKE